MKHRPPVLFVFTLLAIFVGLASPSRAEERVLLTHGFGVMPVAPWIFPHGFWKVEAGGLRGTENPAENHGASVKGFASFRDGTFGYDVRFDGGRVHTLGINQPRAHLFHIDFKPAELLIVKNPIEAGGSDKVEVLARAKLALEQGRWYALRVEIKGETVAVQIGDVKLSAAHANLSREKGSFNLYVNGESVSFRQFRLTTNEVAGKP